MANEQNLRPIKQSNEEATENGRKGGIASGEARRQKRDLDIMKMEAHINVLTEQI